MKPITFEKARITGVALNLPGPIVSSQIKVLALLDARAAEALGARDALRDVLKSGDLELFYPDISMTFTVDRLSSLQLNSEMASKFKVIKKD